MIKETHYSLENANWYEHRPMPELTQEQQSILNAHLTGSAPSEQQMALSEWISTQVKVPVDSTVALQLQAIFDSKDIPVGAEIIDAHITLPDGRGIINCRSGNGHQQIRF